MPAKTPEEICSLFQQYMASGDLESLLGLYDPEAAFLDQAREVSRGKQAIRRQLAPMAAARARFGFNITQVVESADIALMHTHWTISSPQPMSVHAVEVARRQPDGTWCWLIGDPFTIGRIASSDSRAA